MDVSLPDRPLRRAAWGACQGAVLGGLLSLAARYAGLPFRFAWGEAWPFLLGGAAVCAAGQYLARGIVGGCIGLAVGALLGSAMADEMMTRPNLARYHFHQPARLSGITLAGTRYDVAQRSGKVVLIAFWAPWHTRSRAETAVWKKIHDRHREGAFELVGVSMETSREELAACVETDGLAWSQILPDGRGAGAWEDPALFQELAGAIPYTLVVDREGTIVAAGLTGARLEDAVGKVLAGRSLSAPIAAGFDEPWMLFFAAAGALGGMLVERRLRQIVWLRRAERLR